MEQKTNFLNIVIAIIIIGVIAFLLTRGPKDDVVTQTPPPTEGNATFTNPNIDARQLCYIWNTEAGDKAQLSMDIRGSEVIGELNWLPAEKDKKTGIFKGTASTVDPYSMSRTFDGFWDVSAEGMTSKEQLIIKFGDGTANVGFGEMKDRGDGVYVYAHPESLSYEPNLSQTDCGDNAMD
jgi:hypothetical protein